MLESRARGRGILCPSRRNNVEPKFKVVYQRQKIDQFFLATLIFGFTRRQFIDRSGLAQRNLGQRGAGRGQAGTGLVSLLAFGVI